MLSLPVNAVEQRWIEHVRSRVVGRLLGDASTRARTAALGTWWALKEGILDLPNPWRHNLCAENGGQAQIPDLATCSGSTWQVGMAGVQPGAVGLTQVEATARTLYPGTSIPSLLARVASDAGVDPGTRAEIEAASGELEKAWLLRDPAIGFQIQRPFIEACLRSSAPGWCFGSWPTARSFAADPANIQATIAALETYFHGAPVPGDAAKKLVFLAGLGLVGYGLYRVYGMPSSLRRFV